MTTYAFDYVLGASVRIIVEAEDEDAASVIARDLVEIRLGRAEDVLAEHALDVYLCGPPDLADVDEVSS